MRTLAELFPLATSETLIAQGSYTYRCNGELTDISEPWLRHRQADGSVVTRSSRSDGESFVLGAKYWCKAGVVFASLYWENVSGVRTASYALGAGGLRWSADGSPPVSQACSPTTVFFPLMRIFSGDTLLAIMEQGGEATVLVPSIKTPEHAESLFAPLFSERCVEQVTTDVYHYRGGEYDDAACYQLGADGLLQRYEWQQSPAQLWVVELVQSS
ncbi:hypothetical protein [Litorivivens sp.]|uniref:hypothetical protein n=1 Tax=Litorivivens sp. TaxID=2020868 RepID=UPI003563D45D